MSWKVIDGYDSPRSVVSAATSSGFPGEPSWLTQIGEIPTSSTSVALSFAEASAAAATPIGKVNPSNLDLAEVHARYINSADKDAVLRENHHGSKGHPDTCRACRFHRGLCWKGFACDFCHLCSKFKRKSKHQQDFEKRREERYKMVYETQGPEAFMHQMTIDVLRKKMMKESEIMKQVLTAIYADADASLHKDPLSIASLQRQEEEIKRIIKQASMGINDFQEASRKLKALVPYLSLEEREGEEDDDDSEQPTVDSAAAAINTSIPGHFQPAISFAAASSSAAAARTTQEEARERAANSEQARIQANYEEFLQQKQKPKK
jgi:hypothetical protein